MPLCISFLLKNIILYHFKFILIGATRNAVIIIIIIIYFLSYVIQGTHNDIKLECNLQYNSSYERGYIGNLTVVHLSV